MSAKAGKKNELDEQGKLFETLTAHTARIATYFIN
jgi:hypothetical protein